MKSLSQADIECSKEKDDKTTISLEKGDNHSLKVFIGGLNYITMKSDLQSYFETYGKVVKCSIQYNSQGKSRCFGFVTFESEDEEKQNELRSKLFSRKHEINGKIVDVKLTKTPENENTYIKNKFGYSSNFIFVPFYYCVCDSKYDCSKSFLNSKTNIYLLTYNKNNNNRQKRALNT